MRDSFFEKIKSKFSKMKKGGRLTFTLLTALSLLLIIAAIVICIVLSSFLKSYEDSRPFYVARKEFTERFLGDDFSAVYEEVKDNFPLLIGKEGFGDYMNSLKNGGGLSYAEVSNGLSDDMKYSILSGDEIIGYFTLTPSGEKNSHGFDMYKWGSVDIRTPEDKCYIIRVEAGSRLFIGDELVDRKFITETGSLITGDYEIYSIPGFAKKPDWKVLFDGYFVSVNGSDNPFMFSVESLGDVSDDMRDIATIRVISGSEVFVNGEKLPESLIDLSAHGSVEGYYRGKNALEYDIYVFTGNADKVSVKDPDGRERELIKSPGGNTYSDSAVSQRGNISFLALTTSKVTLSGFEIGKEYTVGETIGTKYNKYMPEGVDGIYFVRYSVDWVGAEPSLEVINSYGNKSEMSEKDGTLTEKIPSDEKLKEEHEKFIIEVSCTIGKIMTNEDGLKFYNSMPKYLVKDSVAYTTFKYNMAYAQFILDHKSYGFRNIVTGNYYKYDDDTFSAQISLEQYLITKDGRELVYPYNYTFYLKKVDGKFLIYDYENEQNPIT